MFFPLSMQAISLSKEMYPHFQCAYRFINSQVSRPILIENVSSGNQYNTAPAFGSLGNEVYKKVSFSFMIPTLIFLGVLYASVSARFVFFRIFEGSIHKSSHTVIGWSSWAGILAITVCSIFLLTLKSSFRTY